MSDSPAARPMPAPIRLIERGQRLQERAWQIERAGWAAMLAVVLAAAAGGFGDGVAARARAAAPDGSLAVAYERFQRTEAGTSFVVTAPAARLRDGRLTACLDHAMLSHWILVGHRPAGEGEAMTPDGLCVTAALTPAPGADTTPPLALLVRPRLMAFPARGAVVVPGGAPAPVAAVIWP